MDATKPVTLQEHRIARIVRNVITRLTRNDADNVTYRCCEHCVDSPTWHEVNPPDTHPYSCLAKGCVIGNTPSE